MRFRRVFKKSEPADPFAAFSERYGKRAPQAEPDEPTPENGHRPQEATPVPTPHSWAHDTLGVHIGASQKEISAAYRRLAMTHHPDVPAGDEERMKEINIAYRELGG